MGKVGISDGAINIDHVRFQIGNSYLNILLFTNSNDYYSIRFGRSSRAMQVVSTVNGTDTSIWTL